jgi:hypothetical protein
MPPTDICFLPDTSAETLGFSCGDRIEVDVAIDAESTLRLYVGGDYCSVAGRSIALMHEWLHGRSVDDVIAALSQRCPPASVADACGDATALTRRGRTACVESPWLALKGALSRWQANRPGATCDGALACDACVDARAISWSTVEDADERVVVRSRRTRSILQTVDDLRRIVAFLGVDRFVAGKRAFASFQRFGKLELRPDEVTSMAAFLGRLPPGLLPPAGLHILVTNFMSNICRHRLPDTPPGFRLEFRRQQRAVRLKVGEAEAVRDRLLRARIPFAFVKGIVTRTLYDPTVIRNFSDMDILAPDADAALQIVHLLLREREYQLHGEGAIPFSLKIVSDGHGRQVLTGHVHLSRMLNGHSVVADVSFPGLPLNLVEVMAFPAAETTGNATVEESIVVSMVHVLKHDIAHVKDLNDLRLLLASEEYDIDEVWDLVRRYRLEFVLALVAHVVLKEYDVSAKARTRIRALKGRAGAVQQLAAGLMAKWGWPFHSITQQWAQALDFLHRRKARVGFQRAIEELACTVFGESVPIDDEAVPTDLRDSGLPMFERIYLSPLVINTSGDFRAEHLVGRPLTTPLFRTVDGGSMSLVVVPFGIFLATTSWRSAWSRDALAARIWELIGDLGWDPNGLTFVRNSAAGSSDVAH